MGAVLSGVPALLISKGNYGVNWGNTDYGQGQRGDSWFASNPSAHRPSPFGYNQGATGPLTASISSVTDGTSNTLLMSEILQGAGDDIRGLVWTSFPGSHSFVTRLGPNGNVDFWAGSAYIDPAGGNTMDNLPTYGGSQPGTSPANIGNGDLCDNQPGCRACPASRRARKGGATVRPGAAIPAASIPCWPTAPSGSSRTRSASPPGSPWARCPAAKSSAPTRTERTRPIPGVQLTIEMDGRAWGMGPSSA